MNLELNSYISNILALILGALISSLVSYIFSRIKEDKNLKLSLRIESSRVILEKVQELIDELYHLKYQYYYLDVYMELKDKDEKNIEYLSEISKRVLKENDIFLEKLESTMYKSQILISTFESREVILSTLSRKKKELENLQMSMTLKYADFATHFSMELYSPIESLSTIPTEKYEEITNMYKDFEKFRKSYIEYTNQYKKDVQNEYLSKLFKHTV